MQCLTASFQCARFRSRAARFSQQLRFTCGRVRVCVKEQKENVRVCVCVLKSKRACVCMCVFVANRVPYGGRSVAVEPAPNQLLYPHPQPPRAPTHPLTHPTMPCRVLPCPLPLPPLTSLPMALASSGKLLSYDTAATARSQHDCARASLPLLKKLRTRAYRMRACAYRVRACAGVCVPYAGVCVPYAGVCVPCAGVCVPYAGVCGRVRACVARM